MSALDDANITQVAFGVHGFHTMGSNVTFGTRGFGTGFSYKKTRLCYQSKTRQTHARLNRSMDVIPSEECFYNSDFMVYPHMSFIRKYQYNEDHWLNLLVKRRTEDLEKLSRDIVMLHDECKATPEEMKKKEHFRLSLQNMIKDFDQGLDLNWNTQVFATGSSISGLACRGSDVDLCLYMPCLKSVHVSNLESFDTHEREVKATRIKAFNILQIVREMLVIVMDRGHFPYVARERSFLDDYDREDNIDYEDDYDMVIRDAQIPILKVHTECGLEVDISVCGETFLSGVHNSLLIHGYTKSDPRFAPLAIFVKQWANKTKLKQPKPPHAKFNSYAVTMLLIHFLQCGVSPPVLPNLREKCGPEFYATTEEQFPMKIDLRKMPIPNISSLTTNTMSIAELFIRFCLYYELFNFRTQAISLRKSRVQDRNNFLTRMKKKVDPRLPVYIEDPIDQHNPGRTCYDVRGAHRIFRRTKLVFKETLASTNIPFPTISQLLRKEPLYNGVKLLRLPLTGKLGKPDIAVPKKKRTFNIMKKCLTPLTIDSTKSNSTSNSTSNLNL